MTLWFHPVCAAYKRPEPLLAALGESPENVADRGHLESLARTSLAHRRLPRIDGAELSPGSQASCRHCRERIERGSWRLRLVYYEEGMFTAGGFIHLPCRAAYFETEEVLDRVLHFSSDLTADQLQELKRAAESSPGKS
jgi:hypothetical protein